MDIEEYEREGREAYAAFATKIAEILKAAIDAETGYRLQQVKDRAKQTVSLRKKLEKRDAVETATLEDDIKDLAGCRVIFYTNGDVTRFISSGIIQQNFDVIDFKLHQPQRDIEDANELYISNHYIVRLGPERAAMPEYSRYAGMRCEVQIQTILNHAWAEMAHDTIYKAPALENFGTKALEGIKSRLQKVARKYLMPAGYEFQKIASDFDRLIEGKELFDGDVLEAIVEAENNNIRAEAIETFTENILPFCDDPKAAYPEMVERLIVGAERARAAETVAIETPYGALQGKTYSDIIEGITAILSRYRYLDVEITFDALCKLYGLAEDEEARETLLGLARDLAQHNLHVWRQRGPIVQSILVDRIGALSEDESRWLRPLLVEILKEILGSEVHGTTNSSNTVTIHRGAVTVSEALSGIRAKAIDLLKYQFALAESDEDRISTLQALQAATRRPVGAKYSNEFARMVVDDTCTVVEFMTEIAPTLRFESLQNIEETVYRWYLMYAELPEAMREDPDIVAARESIEAAAIGFRDAVNADPEFSIYKTLVGFNSVFPPAWESEDFNLEQENAYRNEQVNELLASVDEASADVWFGRINRCASTESNDLATFPVFGKFLESLAEAQPAIVLGYIDRLEGALVNFLPSMLSGLIRGTGRTQALERINAWIDEGNHIGHIAWFLRSVDDFDEGMLRRTLDIAIEHGDGNAVRTILKAAVDQFDAHPGTLIDRVFLPAIRYLEADADFIWVRPQWFSWLGRSIIKALDEEQAIIVLGILIPCPRLESGAEYIAASIAERWPARVVEFIGERQVLARTDDAPPRYDAVPFSVHQLRAPLAAAPDEMLEGARAWFNENPMHFTFDGGRLLASVFPDLADGLEERLSALVSGGNEDDLAFVLGVLSAYEGKPCIYGLIHAIVASLAPGSPLLSNAEFALSETGTVSGEFGFAELYAERKLLLEPWLADPSELVRTFAEDQIKNLDLKIKSENRSAEARIAHRKLDYDEELDEDGEE